MKIERPQDLLWQAPDALSAQELRALRQAVVRHRERDLACRTVAASDSFDELMAESAAIETERLYVAGGDGTVHAAVAAFLSPQCKRAPPEFAVIPRGTGNDFARALGMDLGDWDGLLQQLTARTTQKTDIGHIDDSIFVNAVTIGFGAEATRDLPRTLKDTAGGVSYVALTAYKAFAAEAFSVQLECRDESWRGDALAMVVMNGNTIGGGMRVGVDSKLDDGLLDIVILPAFGPQELPDVVEDWYRRESSLFEHVQYFQTPEARFTASRDVAISVDGEPSSGRRFFFRSQPSSATFVVASPA